MPGGIRSPMVLMEATGREARQRWHLQYVSFRLFMFATAFGHEFWGELG